MTEIPLVELADVSRRFGNDWAVRGASFTLLRRQVLGLLGPNGAGKSSLMRMICGVMAMSAGSIRINGYDLVEHPLEARASIGYLPEDQPLYGDLSVDEYLGYCARLRGIRGADAALAVREAKHGCGLERAGDRPLRNLSRGYRQRAGLAQAIVHRPAVVVLDEPTAGLDPIQISEVRDLICDLSERCGILLSTHVLPEAESVCDRVLIVHRGRIVFDKNTDGVESGDGTQNTCIALRRPPPLAELRDLPCVHQVQILEDGRFLLRHESAPECLDTLVASAARRDWGLHELIPEQGSLEKIFLRLTRDAHPAETPR